MISIKGLNFAYNEKNKKENNKNVFDNLDFELRWK